ncbi:NAD-dependent epimerase/dehydratase family protein, partial [Jatrophihabitans endophyticus]|uniref:NAD-dependent epimerase/dehydratase family protein n=1 Tax=Jatrophihabitans endophyticus TaxID=1206085 RepID=UPI0019D833F4
MRVLVIGGTGHIGTYLIPRLVRAGFDVVNLSRGESKPYTDLDVWAEVEQVVADRTEREADGTFSDTVAAQRPDVVVDLVCFTLDSAQSLVDGLRGRVGHLLHCGSVWRYGPSLKLPIREGEGSPPADEYGIQKDRIARMLIAETAATGFATTSVHPGHIVGPGWAPIGPLGNASLAQWRPISAGHTVEVPGSGAELMHHVHADDVAQLF